MRYRKIPATGLLPIRYVDAWEAVGHDFLLQKSPLNGRWYAFCGNTEICSRPLRSVAAAVAAEALRRIR
jgi:hypothetical protein